MEILNYLQKINEYEEFFKKGLGDEAYERILDTYKQTLIRVHSSLLEKKVILKSDYKLASEHIFKQIDADVELSDEEKTYAKVFTLLAAHHFSLLELLNY